MTACTRDRAGAVLAVVLLMALALLGLAHGLLVSAEGAYLASTAHQKLVELDALAEGALETSVREGWAAWMDSVAPGDVREAGLEVVGRHTTRVGWRRLSAEAWLLRATAGKGASVPVELRRLVWVLDPYLRVQSLPGVVSVGPDAPPVATEDIVADIVPAVGVVADVELGLITLRELLERGDSVGSSGTPGPRDVGGTCDVTDAWNWGDPTRPYRPCGSYRPLKGRFGGLTVVGGEGQGVLAVDGDVTLTLGARYLGVLVTSGRLHLQGGSVVEGRVIALGGVSLKGGSRVVGSAARAQEALAALRQHTGAAKSLHPAVRMGPE